MEKGLSGKRIAIAGSRKTEEMSTLIEKQGGVPLVRPLQGTVFLAAKEVEPGLRRFIEEGADWIILTTGIGTETLLDLAEKIGIKEEFLKVLCGAKVAARGYKTFAALKKLGIKPVAVDEDGTTRGLIRALEADDFAGQRAMVQLHGENAPALIRFLEEKGASVLQLLPYQYTPPETETVKRLSEELLNNQIDAVCFTTANQVRSLFEYARELGNINEMKQSFTEKALAVAVGKITAEALREEGIERMLVPENERMGAMIIDLSNYYQSQLERETE